MNNFPLPGIHCATLHPLRPPKSNQTHQHHFNLNSSKGGKNCWLKSIKTNYFSVVVDIPKIILLWLWRCDVMKILSSALLACLLFPPAECRLLWWARPFPTPNSDDVIITCEEGSLKMRGREESRIMFLAMNIRRIWLSSRTANQQHPVIKMHPELFQLPWNSFPSNCLERRICFLSSPPIQSGIWLLTTRSVVGWWTDHEMPVCHDSPCHHSH